MAAKKGSILEEEEPWGEARKRHSDYGVFVGAGVAGAVLVGALPSLGCRGSTFGVVCGVTGAGAVCAGGVKV